MTKPEAQAMAVTTQQPQPAPMPSDHVDHATVFYNEANIRKQGFEAGLAALEAEIEGKQIEREEKIAAIERQFASDMESLKRRRTMMVIGIEMAGAALAAWRDPANSEQGQEVPDKNDD